MNTTILISLNEADLRGIIKEAVLEALNTQNNFNKQEQIAEDLLDIRGIQLLFNVSKVTVHKWKKKGLIPFYKMNRKVYFKRTEVINAMTHKKRKMEV